LARKLPQRFADFICLALADFTQLNLRHNTIKYNTIINIGRHNTNYSKSRRKLPKSEKQVKNKCPDPNGI